MNKKTILVIDNYDSFTYNLVQLLGSCCTDRFHIEVHRNDQIDLPTIQKMDPALVITSSGPGLPERAGVTVEVMSTPELRAPRLGIGLGHQAVASAFGGRIIAADRLLHGKTSSVYHDGKGIFQGISNPFVAARYHSLLVEEESLPEELLVSAWTSHGEIMGLRHKTLPINGVQFHPESLETPEGPVLLKNFIDQSVSLEPSTRFN